MVKTKKSRDDADEGGTNSATISSPLLLVEVVQRLRKVCRESKKNRHDGLAEKNHH